MYLYRLLYVLSALLVGGGLLVKIPAVVGYADTILPPLLQVKALEIPFTTLLSASLAVLVAGRVLQVLVDIRRQLLRLRSSVSEASGYPF